MTTPHAAETPEPWLPRLVREYLWVAACGLCTAVMAAGALGFAVAGALGFK